MVLKNFCDRATRLAPAKTAVYRKIALVQHKRQQQQPKRDLILHNDIGARAPASLKPPTPKPTPQPTLPYKSLALLLPFTLLFVSRSPTSAPAPTTATTTTTTTTTTPMTTSTTFVLGTDATVQLPQSDLTDRITTLDASTMPVWQVVLIALCKIQQGSFLSVFRRCCSCAGLVFRRHCSVAHECVEHWPLTPTRTGRHRGEAICACRNRYAAAAGSMTTLLNFVTRTTVGGGHSTDSGDTITFALCFSKRFCC